MIVATDKPPGEHAGMRDKLFNLRVSADELKAWDKAAIAGGFTSTSDFIRHAVATAMRSGKVTAPVDRRAEFARLRKVAALVSEAIEDLEASGKVGGR